MAPMAMTLRPDDAQDHALARLAQRWGTSKQAAALRAIEETDARMQGLEEVGELAERSMRRWGPVYDELAK